MARVELGRAWGHLEDGPRDNHGLQRSTAVNPNSGQDQRRLRDQQGLAAQTLEGMQEVRG